MQPVGMGQSRLTGRGDIDGGLRADTPGQADAVVLAKGGNFADALSAGPLGAVEDAPIVLSHDKDLDAATAAFVSGRSAIEVVGGQAVSAVAQHVAVSGKTFTTLSGATRYETSDRVTGFLDSIAKSAPTGVGLASGTNFPDAMTGGAYAVNAGEPLLLTDPHALPSVIASRLSALAPQLRSITLFGGPSAVSTAVGNPGCEDRSRAQVS